MQEDAEKEDKMEGGLLGDATAAASFDPTAAAGAGARRALPWDFAAFTCAAYTSADEHPSL